MTIDQLKREIYDLPGTVLDFGWQNIADLKAILIEITEKIENLEKVKHE